MRDHLAKARDWRDRAVKCQQSAESTASLEFECSYRLLAKYYVVVAEMEEQFASQLASRSKGN
jgi:hypothetical protein